MHLSVGGAGTNAAMRHRHFALHRIEAANQKSVRGNLVRLPRREVAIHDGAATRAQIGAVLVHAGGDLRDVRDLVAAQAEGVAGAHLLRLGAEGETSGRGQRAERGGEGPRNTGLGGGPWGGGGPWRVLLARRGCCLFVRAFAQTVSATVVTIPPARIV